MNMAIILFLQSATICIRTAAFGAPPPRHGIGHGRNPVTAKEAAEAKEANEKSKRRIAPYLTDEGASGRLTWKEYTVNPKAKGEATLLEVGDTVVLGGLGCYSFAQQSWFNGIRHPDVVLVSRAEGERTVLSWDYPEYLREFFRDSPPGVDW